jgi:hypothetical protein
MLPAGLVWESGEEARVTALDGENVIVRSAKPSAPGSRPSGRLKSGLELRMKVHRCRREDLEDGLVFTIDGRLLDATRALRGEIERLLRDPSAPADSGSE